MAGRVGGAGNAWTSGGGTGALGQVSDNQRDANIADNERGVFDASGYQQKNIFDRMFDILKGLDYQMSN